MSCNFLESELFYHHQSSSQGKRESIISDPLHWLLPPEPVPGSAIPLETVNNSAAPISETGVQSQELSIATPMISPDPIPEVNSEPIEPTIITHLEDVPEQDNTIDADTGRYVLPLRSKRGVPPKRYSPKKCGKKARYSMANLVRGSMTEMARAFEVALYEEEEITQSAEEAMKSKHWRDAMKKEMAALARNCT